MGGRSERLRQRLNQRDFIAALIQALTQALAPPAHPIAVGLMVVYAVGICRHNMGLQEREAVADVLYAVTKRFALQRDSRT